MIDTKEYIFPPWKPQIKYPSIQGFFPSGGLSTPSTESSHHPSQFNSFAFHAQHKERPIWAGLHLEDYAAGKDGVCYPECLLNNIWNSQLEGSFLASLLWLHLPIVVEALFSIVSTEGLLMAAGWQLGGGAVQLPFDLGWRWGMKHHWNEKREDSRLTGSTVLPSANPEMSWLFSELMSSHMPEKAKCLNIESSI